MFGMLHPSVADLLRSEKLKRGDRDSDKGYRMQRHGIRFQRALVETLRGFRAAAVRGRHPHLSALIFHHTAASAFLSRHLRVRSHACHCWSHTGHQQQEEDHTKLAQRLHLIEEYAASRNATTWITRNWRSHSTRDCGTNHLKSKVAAKAPPSWAETNPTVSAGLIPAKVSVMERASVTAGLANDVEAVNQ